MGRIIAIGGVTPPLTLDLIDKEIIKLTDKKNPKVLYVPTAGGDSHNYCNFFRSIYEEKFGCKVDILFLIKENPTEDEIRHKVLSSDIIYVEGGSASRLMDYFKKFNMESILKEAYKKGIILAGKSVGAVCWGMYYFEDDDISDFKVHDINGYSEIKCLKFLDFVICPHYNLEEYKEKIEAMVKAHNIVGIALDNNCAIEIIDNNYRIIATNHNANAYKIYQDKTEIKKEVISKDSSFKSIDELIEASLSK